MLQVLNYQLADQDFTKQLGGDNVLALLNSQTIDVTFSQSICHLATIQLPRYSCLLVPRAFGRAPFTFRDCSYLL